MTMLEKITTTNKLSHKSAFISLFSHTLLLYEKFHEKIVKSKENIRQNSYPKKFICKYIKSFLKSLYVPKVIELAKKDQLHKIGCEKPHCFLLKVVFQLKKVLCHLPLKFISAKTDNFWNDKSCDQHRKQ